MIRRAIVQLTDVRVVKIHSVIKINFWHFNKHNCNTTCRAEMACFHQYWPVVKQKDNKEIMSFLLAISLGNIKNSTLTKQAKVTITNKTVFMLACNIWIQNNGTRLRRVERQLLNGVRPLKFLEYLEVLLLVSIVRLLRIFIIQNKETLIWRSFWKEKASLAKHILSEWRVRVTWNSTCDFATRM